MTKGFSTLFIIIMIPFMLLFLLIGIYIFIAQPNQIKGRSMNPSFQDGMFVLSEKLTPKYGHLERGDVVFFKSPRNPDIDFFARIVGLPGETISLKDNVNVFINGQRLVEPYLAPGTKSYYHQDGVPELKNGGDLKIPENTYFVMGDSRERSSDSRDYGALSKDLIFGKYLLCYVSCDKP